MPNRRAPMMKAIIGKFIFLLLIPCVTACLPSNAVFVAKDMGRPTLNEGDAQGPEEPGTFVTRPSLKVMTFNIRWQGYYDGQYHDSGFAQRKPLVLDVLQKFGADIIALQEASMEQRSGIAPDLPGFSMFPPPTEAGDECILYRWGRFALQDSGREYLRRVPEIPGTNIGVRDFVWVYLHDRFSGKRFYVLNLHMDHRSSSRGCELDGVLIGEWIRRRKFTDPVILVGDFNGTPDKPRYLYLTGQRGYPDQDGITVTMPMPMLDTFRMANPDAQYPGTTNSRCSGKKNSNQIDYVFVPRGSTVIDSRIIYYHVNGSYPSDHFPLLSEFELK
jgi:endonuclease/exonuclease/phosphatase family metal-dependent hydrolase